MEDDMIMMIMMMMMMVVVMMVGTTLNPRQRHGNLPTRGRAHEARAQR